MLLLLPISLIAAGLAIRMALAWAYGARGPGQGDSLYLLLQVIAWVMIGMGTIVCVSWPVVGGVWVLAVVALLWLWIAIAVVDAVVTSRQMHRRTNSKLLAIAAETGNVRQAADLLDTVAEGIYVGDAASRLAYDLYAGMPLGAAVASHPRALPREATGYLAIGEVAGAEVAALHELSRPADVHVDVAWQRWLDQLTYATAILLMMGVFLTFYMIFIIPQFRAIFEEFGLELPPATEWLVGASAGGQVVWAALLFFLVITLIGILVALFLWTLDVPLLQEVSDRFLMSRHTAGALRMIALAIDERADLAEALRALAMAHPIRRIRGRLAAASREVDSGLAWSDALVRHRLLSKNERALAATADQAGNLPWALRQIAHRRESLLAARLASVGNLVFPLMIAALGLGVAFVVIALFVPLVKLIEGLS